MGILTTILILVIPLIFKGVDKYISNSANQKVSGPKKFVISDNENDDYGTDEDEDNTQDESVVTNIEAPVKYNKSSDLTVNDLTLMELEEESEKKVKKDKIDPKKLIIYSEIMKPKY